MKKIAVVSPKGCSESAKRLASLLNCPCLLAEEKDYSNYDFIFNYGSSIIKRYNRIINSPQAVKICVNKLSTLKRLRGACSTIEWSKDVSKAREWFRQDGVVIGRKRLEGKQGDGYLQIEDENSIEDASIKLYTRYFFHTNEVRINVFKNNIISVFDKVLEEVDGKYIFRFVPLKIQGATPQIEQMIASINNTIGIDFYGMDVLYDGQEYKLLEVNSGAILYPQTEKSLVEFIKRSFND